MLNAHSGEMVQINLLSGSKAGTSSVARRFPVRIGRSADCDIQLEEPGVWDEHLQLDLKRGEGFILKTCGAALAAVNSRSATEPVLLRNGDRIDLGAARLQFWLAPPRQKGFALREWLIWTGL